MRTKVEGNVSFRKLEESDIPKIDADYLDGKNLVEEGYYIVWVDSDPSKYVYMKTFGPVDPNVEPTFNLAPYAYIDHCGFLGDYLYIDTAAIENDETRNLPRQISVHFVEDVPGENTAIFKSDETGNYYMRISSYPREQFARWVTAHKKHGCWEDGSHIRPNVSFVMGEARETVRATTWNGSAVYSDQFDLRFEGIDRCDKCGGMFSFGRMSYTDDPNAKYHKLCKECYQQTIEFEEMEAENKRRKEALSFVIKMRFFESPNFSMTSDGEEVVLAKVPSQETARLFVNSYAIEVLKEYCGAALTRVEDIPDDSGFSVKYNGDGSVIQRICFNEYTACLFTIEKLCPNCGCNPQDEPYCMEATHCPQCGMEL